ncbi:MAG: hypothetical protein MR321_10350 [Bacteroides sp.]|jgi:hypothetical protein|uniref:hypothetical protein n=1 Tax=Phocaeicola faecicola TaxID=2739389 RepID=UPI0015E655C9|nr:hypothetical protein [Phocaeicola faecicola]MCI5744026.1 hypothetical protein [Bacteroides sp.]
MFTLGYDIKLADFRLGMLDKVEIHRSVELLADTATIVLPGSEYNKALDVESLIKRGDPVSISIGYEETGLREEFRGWIQRISTDDGSITIECEDDLYKFRKSLPNEELKAVTLESLLKKVISGIGESYKLDCTYSWTYEKFVINTATGYDVLKKVQEESGADIYLADDTLHVHAPAEAVGDDVFYNFSLNVEECDLTYRKAEDRKVQVVVKATMPDGTVKEIETGTTGGDKVEIRCATSDEASMKKRGETEVKRLSFDGYDGNITTWLIPYCKPGDTAELKDEDYPEKDGRYFVQAVTTEFSRDGGKRTVELGFRLS